MALLGNLKGSAQLFQDTEFYNGVATQSLRFEDGDSSYLYRTPSSGGNRRTFTFSAWIKRGNFDENNVGGSSDTTIFSAGTSSVFDTLRFVSQSFTSIKNILTFVRVSFPILIGKIFILSNSGLAWSLSKDGISSLQGSHQVAQKFNINKFPVYSLILIF